MTEPGDADPLTQARHRHPGADLLDDAHDLVPRHDRQADVRQFAVDDMQIGAADAAGFDAHDDLARGGDRVGSFDQRKPLAGG